MAKKLPKIQVFRRVVLGVFLVGFTTLAILHQKLQGIPSVDALDPFGGLETLFKWIASGDFIKKIEPGNIVLLGAIIVLGIVLSRFFCGWLCAFGALQGAFGWLGKKIFKRRFEIPQKIDRVLRYAKYVILVGIIYFTWKTGELVIRPYEPFAAYAHLPVGLSAVWTEFGVGLVLLVVFMALSVFTERAFCKYACPLGAVNAILGRVPLFRIKRDAPTCISCSKCDRVCPMNIEVSTADSVKSAECISCFECVTACPTKKDTLVATIGGKKVKLWTVVIIGFAIYAGAALIGQITGMLKFTPPTLASLAAQGSLKVEDIKGSTTYDELATAFGIDVERIYRELGLDPAKVPTSTKIKDTGAVAGIEGFETDAARVAVAKILGIPYSGEGETTASGSGAKTEASAVPAQPSMVAPNSSGAPVGSTVAPATSPATVQSSSVASPAVPGAASSAATDTVPATSSLKVPEGFALEGTMTIQEAAKALGWSTQQVIEKLGLPKDIPTDKPLREMGSLYGYTMPKLKEKIAQ